MGILQRLSLLSSPWLKTNRTSDEEDLIAMTGMRSLFDKSKRMKMTELLDTSISESRGRFLQALDCMSENQEATANLLLCQEWYLGVCKIPLSGYLTYNLSLFETSEHSLDFRVCLRYLSHIVELLAKQKDLALDEINAHLSTHAFYGIEEDTTAKQLLFISIGLITMLYEPTPVPQPMGFQLASESSHVQRNATWLRYTQPIENTEQPFGSLLRAFGGFQSPIPRSEAPLLRQTGSSEHCSLFSANLSFYILSQLAGISIVWVGNVCEHLELSIRDRKLKLFCYPSFCATICNPRSDTTYLCQ
jgi:hypothetical protein